VRGCLRRDGTCSARFPRDVFPKTEVDPADGAINVKKLEPMLNCITPDVTYCLRCNTDVTSLLSGTSIKAVVAYISDYVTKATLKLYHIFDTVRIIIDKKDKEVIGGTEKTTETTRVMIMQMVNSLTSKLQIGSPMASLYLLGNPDHYTNLNFKPFWWRSYLLEVKKSWPSESPQDGMPSDCVLLMKTGDKYLGVNNVEDYKHRPQVFEDTCLYDYIQMTTRKKRTKKQLAEFMESLREKTEGEDVEMRDREKPNTEDDDWLENDLDGEPGEEFVGDLDDTVSSHPFSPKHLLYKTHYIRCDRRDLDNMVPNFVGGSLPRVDQGDREFYCCTMMTLFKPWRSGKDLKNELDNWHEAFTDNKFNEKALKLMRNFNVKYECNDARDDFASQDRQKRRALPSFGIRHQDEDDESDAEDLTTYGEDYLLEDDAKRD
ncbi:hypothetical protein C8R44DRAFT_543779, partial [Mycena epipterygia]